MTGRFADNTIVAMVEEHHRLTAHLQSTGEISLLATVEPAFAKTLLVSAASYYEDRMTEVIVGLYEYNGNSPVALAEFVRNQAIGRRFAQLFTWGDTNANRFFRLFGNEFLNYMRQEVLTNRILDESIRAFLELGKLRNDMVHGNYADFPLNKTADDVFGLYQKAGPFVDGFADHIKRHMAGIDPSN